MMKTAITILNWNSIQKTIKCLDAVKKSIDFCGFLSGVSVYLLDNGSRLEDWYALQEYSSNKSWINLLRSDVNTGFAGGHNLLMRLAIEDDCDYIWVLNNDTVAEEGCLASLIELMENDHGCGAVSPVIYITDNPEKFHVLGGVHRWKVQNADMVQDVAMIRSMEQLDPLNFWISGAAMFLRVTTLRKTGLFDESLFAYYEDNDLCARMALDGYRCRIAYAAFLAHESPQDYYRERKAYYFYLMARNEILFWLKNTPHAWRRSIRYRLLKRTFVMANRLSRLGYLDKSAASLIGAWDGLMRKGGGPNEAKKPPVLIVILFRLYFFNSTIKEFMLKVGRF